MTRVSEHQHHRRQRHQDRDQPQQQPEQLRLAHTPGFAPGTQNNTGRRVAGTPGPRTEHVPRGTR